LNTYLESLIIALPCCLQVGLDNPAELKAAKLARSVTRGLIDKDLKPNSDERRRIQAVLQLPPNKPLSQEAKALLWRFR
jgi:phosphatidylinositol 3-kinase